MKLANNFNPRRGAFYIKGSIVGVFAGILSIALALVFKSDKSISIYFYEYGKVILKYSFLTLIVSIGLTTLWKFLQDIRDAYKKWSESFNKAKKEYLILDLKIRTTISLSWGLCAFLCTFLLYSSGDGTGVTSAWLINVPLIAIVLGYLFDDFTLSVKFPVGLAYLWGLISYILIVKWMSNDYNFDMDKSGHLTYKDLGSVIYYFAIAPAYLISEIQPEVHEALTSFFDLRRSSGKTITEVLLFAIYVSFILIMRRETKKIQNILDEMLEKKAMYKKKAYHE